MPTRSSHLMAALISARWPSNSRQTTPISSVTLACRTLVTTLNFCPNCQTTGMVISFGGNISHKRVFCGWLLAAAAAGDLAFFPARGIRSASRDGRNDAHFVAVLDGRLLVLEEAYVLFVHVNID